eukprot:8903393-Alexandrium_andersonii.AAC.1
MEGDPGAEEGPSLLALCEGKWLVHHQGRLRLTVRFDESEEGLLHEVFHRGPPSPANHPSSRQLLRHSLLRDEWGSVRG